MRGGHELTVEIGRTHPVVLIGAAGELDASGVGRVDEAVDEAIREHDCHVVLDTRAVTFIDSTGITALIGALRRLNRARRRLAVVIAPAGPVARALELTGLDHTFECHPAVDDAVADLAGAPLIGR